MITFGILIVGLINLVIVIVRRIRK